MTFFTNMEEDLRYRHFWLKTFCMIFLESEPLRSSSVCIVDKIDTQIPRKIDKKTRKKHIHSIFG